jgi:hypothetical protein
MHPTRDTTALIYRSLVGGRVMLGVGRLLIAMDRNIFEQHLAKATEIVLPFSREFVTNPLPSSCRYLIFPNQSYDGNPLEGDEQVFPEEALPEGEYLGPFDAARVVEHLWRNGRVPEWVNVTIYSYDERYMYLELLCCGRFSAMEEYLYHKVEGYPPFHVLGPNLPPHWESVEANGKFDLYWHGRKPKGIS